jgi:hypothetical protein
MSQSRAQSAQRKRLEGWATLGVCTMRQMASCSSCCASQNQTTTICGKVQGSLRFRGEIIINHPKNSQALQIKVPNR